MEFTFKYKDILVFKSPHRINWKATENNITTYVKKSMPDSQLSELAAASADIIMYTHKLVTKYGVHTLYLAINFKKG